MAARVSLRLFALLIAPAAAFATAALPGSKGILWSVDWSPNGQSFAVSGEWIRIFDVASFEPVALPALADSKPASKVRWQPGGKRLAVSGGAYETTAIYDFVSQQKTLLPTNPRKEGTRGIAWDPTGQRLATAGNDGSLQIWTVEGTLLHTYRAEKSKSLTGVAWHPSEDKIVTVGEFIRLHDSSGTLLKQIVHRTEEKGVVLLLCVEWHPSGEFFAVSDYGNPDTGAIPAIQFWSSDGQLLKTIEVKGAALRNVSWSPDGRWLASASDALRIWSKSGELQHEGKSPDLLWGVRWHPQGNLILTSSMEGRVTLWTPAAIVERRIVEPKD